MLLAVDIGNSETTVGLFRGEEMVDQWRLTTFPRETGDELFVHLHAFLTSAGRDPREVKAVAVCSVVPGLARAYERLAQRLTGTEPFFVSHRTVPDLRILYHDPSAVGADRIVNAVAVREEYGAPAIVVDLGTATTFDVVNARGEYAGGVIAPGLLTSAQALFDRGARLARVEVVRPERVVGRTTEESMQAGIYYGTVGGVDTLVRAIIREQEFPSSLPVVATGGLAAVVAQGSETITAVDEWLTVRGIRRVWETAGRGPGGGPASRG